MQQSSAAAAADRHASRRQLHSIWPFGDGGGVAVATSVGSSDDDVGHDGFAREYSSRSGASSRSDDNDDEDEDGGTFFYTATSLRCEGARDADLRLPV